MSDGQKHENDLDQVNAELAEQTGRPAPEYNLIAMTPSGRMLGAVTLAPGLMVDLDDACGGVQRFFQAMNGVHGGVNVRPLTDFEAKRAAADLREKLVIPKPVIPKPNVDLGQVLVDVKNATDCCIITLGDYCLGLTEIKPDTEVACKGCGSTFRYVNDGEGNYAWLWMLPKKYVRPQREVVPLEQAFEAAKERSAQRDSVEARWDQQAEMENFAPMPSPGARPIRVEYQAGYDPVTGEALKSLSFTGEARPPMPPGARYLRIHEGSQVGDMFASGKLTPAAANLIESGQIGEVPPDLFKAGILTPAPPLYIKELQPDSTVDWDNMPGVGRTLGTDRLIDIQVEGLEPTIDAERRYVASGAKIVEVPVRKTTLDGEGLPGEDDDTSSNTDEPLG